MKKVILFFALIFLAAGTYATENFKRTDDVSKVSKNAVKQFELDFQSAKDVSWRVENEFVKANFSFEGKKMAALYDLQGTYLGAVEYLSYEQLPVQARSEIGKQYKNYNFSSALKIIARPYGSDLNDVGTYWVNLSNNVKDLFITVSPSSKIALQKSTAVESTAKN